MNFFNISYYNYRVKPITNIVFLAYPVALSKKFQTEEFSLLREFWVLLYV